ncbi:aminomethyl-transferring glycine dehydrogenase subunit GcvPA [Desulforhopalus vacuolatus]|uniref:aminomethyl-transferring glycine dehydrogenase subunit GcvPA n=1 Tax=Desulforhopalus vacuolatus TaxID=40414 RepID=UPI00196471B7|nr:aminomethyl-transferring glycine dehydrogenase subunit GcvPA [Desulforhopalus vacuolatus]MBM9518500.1 aminomethyl-transferring glycine dehydrogenase subunit GcvPA [Desulforhopalus vacuolatus]
MRYLPHTEDDISRMFQAIGLKDFDELFAAVPTSSRHDAPLDLPAPKSEWELIEYMNEIQAQMAVGSSHHVLIGAGRYHHYIPCSIPTLMGRSEFLTAYTPYQSEMAQGTLQGLFEYQTLTARLLGVEVANASMYDGASGLAEALLMSLRIKKKETKVAISSAVHPHYREVVRTYFAPTDFEVIELPVLADGRTDLSAAADIEGLAAVAVQSPNFFGVVEDLPAVSAAAHDKKALSIVAFTEAMAYGLLKRPGSCDVDIVCGDGQSFGMPREFGGPGLGMFGCKQAYVRNLPGRLVGKTQDVDGKTGYVLTLATREQHIRREKATSNICSNQGIMTLIAAMYMASTGGTGLRTLARQNYDKAEYLKAGLLAAGGRLTYSGPTYNEFVMEFDCDFAAVQQRLLAKKIVAGLNLGQFYENGSGKWLFCATETASRKVLDSVIEEVKA